MLMGNFLLTQLRAGLNLFLLKRRLKHLYMAQTGYKCFKDGIKAVPRDLRPTASPLHKLGDILWVGLRVFSLASDISCCYSLVPPEVAQPLPIKL